MILARPCDVECVFPLFLRNPYRMGGFSIVAMPNT